MIYTFDANFFIDAARFHFPVDQQADFWNWLITLADSGVVKTSEDVYEEVTKGNDHLADWIRQNSGILVCRTQEYVGYLPGVLEAYGACDEVTLERLRADPYAIAHAMQLNGCVVTSEKPNGATAAHNKKIPSVCSTLNIPCYTFSRFMWEVRTTMPS